MYNWFVQICFVKGKQKWIWLREMVRIGKSCNNKKAWTIEAKKRGNKMHFDEKFHWENRICKAKKKNVWEMNAGNEAWAMKLLRRFVNNLSSANFVKQNNVVKIYRWVDSFYFDGMNAQAICKWILSLAIHVIEYSNKNKQKHEKLNRTVRAKWFQKSEEMKNIALFFAIKTHIQCKPKRNGNAWKIRI